MPRSHQLAACVLTRPDEITGRFFVRLGDADRNQLAQAEQPREPLRITPVGLEPTYPQPYRRLP
jgi:hypothetical protein